MISTTLYHTYQLSYYEAYIQMTANYSTTEVEAGEIEYKNETWHSLYLGFLLTYIICINHYIVQDTFRWEDFYYIISYLPAIILYRTDSDDKYLQHNQNRSRRNWV